MPIAIESRKKKLDAFFARCLAIPDEEVQSDLAKLGAVLACGFVERSVEILILEKISYRAHVRVQSFVKSHFKKGTNYDCEAICQLLERFDLGWSKRMKDWMATNDGPVSSLTSVYSLRNSIAHGGNLSAGLRRVSDLYEDCKKVVDAMISATR